jgi:hypothetical protein
MEMGNPAGLKSKARLLKYVTISGGIIGSPGFLSRVC